MELSLVSDPLGFQTPKVRRYDWTPKTYHPNTEPQEVFGRPGDKFFVLFWRFFSSLVCGGGFWLVGFCMIFLFGFKLLLLLFPDIFLETGVFFVVRKRLDTSPSTFMWSCRFYFQKVL